MRPWWSHCQICERRDLGRGRILHQVVDRDRARPVQPGGEVLDADRDVVAQPSSVTSPGVDGDVEQIGGAARRRRRAAARSGSAASPSTASNASSATGTRSGWATQVPSKPCDASRSLSSRTFASATSFTLGVAAGRDEGGHAAHCERAPAMARLDEQLAVGAHERHGHRHGRAVRQHELGPVTELLDDAEDVVPATGVQARPSGRAARTGSRPSRTPRGSSRSGRSP